MRGGTADRTRRRAGGGRRVLAVVAALGVLALPMSATAVPAAPVGWSDPAPIPGSDGFSEQASATAPDGADAVVWAAPGSQVRFQLRAKVRAPGSTTWVKVPVAFDNVDVTQVTVAASPGGDFWVAWVSSASRPEVFVARLDTSAGRWGGRTQVFHQDGYGHLSPRLAVAGNGAVAVSALAKPDFRGPWRAVVSVREKGATSWRGRFLSDLSAPASRVQVGAGPSGDLAVTWVEGDTLAQLQVRVATRARAAGSAWSIGSLGGPGDGQLVSRPAIAADGSVALGWIATASAATEVRVATASAGEATWHLGVVQPPGPVATQVAVVAAPQQLATVVWRQTGSGGSALIRARSFHDPVLGATLTLSQSGQDTSLEAVGVRTDGQIAVLTHQFDHQGGSLGLRYRLVAADVPGALVTLTDGTEPDETRLGLGLTATGLATIIETRGAAPAATGFAAFGEVYAAPVATTSPLEATSVTAAKATGTARVGKTLRCSTGFWVEAATRAYGWRRDGKAIRGARAASYTLVAGDRGHQVSCAVVAGNDIGSTRLTSPARRVR